jgi:hypothetical protein
MRNPFLSLAASVPLAVWSSAALAQAPRNDLGDKCNVTFDPVTLSQPYNPLSPDDYAVSFTATAHRRDRNLRTAFSGVLLKDSNYRLPTELYVIADDGGGGGVNVVYPRPGPPLDPGVDDAGEIDLLFDSTAGFSSARTVDLQFRIPAGTAMDTGTVEAEFDVKYLCEYAEERPDRGYVNRGLRIEFTVSNAVQASLVGTEPDFGEIGRLSDRDVAQLPPSFTQRRQYMRVASNGPFEVDVVSQNGWRMTASGAPTGNRDERIGYSYELLGQTLTSGRPNFSPVQCDSSGLAGQNLALTATLTEGGEDKVPSANYRDTVTITITPLAAGTGIGSPDECD